MAEMCIRDRGMAVWMQGCTVGCKKCTSPHTWNKSRGKLIDVAALLEIAIKENQARLTISGGEPLEQPEATTDLAKSFRLAMGDDFEIVLYTSYDFKDIPKAIIDNCDVVITGKYESELKPNPLAGSTNQIVHCLTPLAKALYVDWQNWPMHQTKLVITQSKEHMHFVTIGIPKKKDLL